ncbi:MAG: type III-B CRISPR module-associated protein Cmr5 [Sulfuricurvum sp.]
MSDVKDLSKARSQFAYQKVVDAIAKYPNVIDEKTKKSVPSKQQKEYKAYIKKIPMMILTNGLGATFAFVYSKKDKDAYGLIYKQVDEWLKVPQNVELVKWIIDQESPEYRAVTNEVLALFNWLKRFADGMIEGDGDGN